MCVSHVVPSTHTGFWTFTDGTAAAAQYPPGQKNIPEEPSGTLKAEVLPWVGGAPSTFGASPDTSPFLSLPASCCHCPRWG